MFPEICCHRHAVIFLNQIKNSHKMHKKWKYLHIFIDEIQSILPEIGLLYWWSQIQLHFPQVGFQQILFFTKFSVIQFENQITDTLYVCGQFSTFCIGQTICTGGRGEGVEKWLRIHLYLFPTICQHMTGTVDLHGKTCPVFHKVKSHKFIYFEPYCATTEPRWCK